MKRILYILAIVLGVSACTNDDYLHDGGKANPYVNMTTYDFLKSRDLFDTLVMAIDRTGLRDMVNGATTLYATTNFTFSNYIAKEVEFRKKLYDAGDPRINFTFDSIPTQLLEDSLKMYLFDRLLPRDSLVEKGKVYESMAGKEIKLSKEPKSDYQGDDAVSNGGSSDELVEKPEYLFFINKVGVRFDAYEDLDKSLGAAETDTRIRCQTSGIITTNGIVHVLDNSHVLFFYDPMK